MTKFAEGTSVPVEKSRAEIERMIVRYGATSTMFMTDPGRAMIVLECKDRRILFELPLPNVNKFAYDGRRHLRSPARRHDAWEQACRQRWRALALIIKTKLEAVESGITNFRRRFRPHRYTGRQAGGRLLKREADDRPHL